MKQLTFILFVFVGVLPACSQQNKEIYFKGEMVRKAIHIGNFYIDPNEELTEEAKKNIEALESKTQDMDKLPIEEQEKDMLWMNYKNLREAGLTNLPMIHLVNKEGKLQVVYLPISDYEQFRPFTNKYLESHIVNVEFEGKKIDFGDSFGSVYVVDELKNIRVSKGESKFFK